MDYEKRTKRKKSCPSPVPSADAVKRGFATATIRAVRVILAKGILTTLTQPYIYALIFNL